MDSHLQKDECNFMDRDLREELTPIYQELEAALTELRSDPTSDERQVNVCLLSRSAFTDFYSLSVLKHEINGWAKGELERMFQEALALLPPQSPYHGSVKERHDEFDTFCNDIVNRDRLDTAEWRAAIER